MESGYGSPRGDGPSLPSEHQDDRGDLPVILVDADEHRVNNEALIALKSEQDLYQRGNLIVQVSPTLAERDTSVRRQPVCLQSIRQVVGPNLQERLSRTCRFVRLEEVDGAWRKVRVHPPSWCVKGILARGNWPEIRKIDDIVSYPVIMPVGSVIRTYGYHDKSRIYMTFPSELELSYPVNPLQEDAVAAANRIFDVVCDFPFERPVHRSAWLAALLTPLAWFMFEGNVPFFLIESNIRDAGKGLLGDVI